MLNLEKVDLHVREQINHFGNFSKSKPPLSLKKITGKRKYEDNETSEKIQRTNDVIIMDCSQSGFITIDNDKEFEADTITNNSWIKFDTVSLDVNSKALFWVQNSGKMNILGGYEEIVDIFFGGGGGGVFLRSRYRMGIFFGTAQFFWVCLIFQILFWGKQ